ncbi:hypothetical protein [Brevibacillus brevis]|nr:MULTISPECIES: hypothetical protein [Bacillales]
MTFLTALMSSLAHIGAIHIALIILIGIGIWKWVSKKKKNDDSGES